MMNQLIPLTKLLPVSCIAALAAAAHIAGAAEPQGAYKPLPRGTVLDYGSWKCSVGTDPDPFVHVCHGPKDKVGKFYGKLVPVGKISRDGYATAMNEYHCTTPYGSHTRSIKSIGLKESARSAIKKLWPLKVGKKVSFKRNIRPMDGSANSTIKVVEKKETQVSGVDRTVFVLEGATVDIHCSQSYTVYVSFKETWWYAPELNAVVRYNIPGRARQTGVRTFPIR